MRHGPKSPALGPTFFREIFAMSQLPVIVFASFRPKPGQEAAVEKILKGMVGPTRDEPGNEIYDLYKKTEAPASYHLFERYADQAALQAHRETAHYKAYRASIVDHLAEPIGVVVLGAVDVKG